MDFNKVLVHAKASIIKLTIGNYTMQKTKTIMVQGTTSDAGKTILVAGLCRWLAQRDINVVPFKPQNMALNSAVSVDGGEIGRAQALQAKACFLAPHTDMNPVLIKPSSDTNAQIIIHGHALKNMDAKHFHDYKKIAMSAVLESHTRLEKNYQMVVVEGAGSPAEVNLRENDIANMGFAEAVDCPVILIADIDRGGVFAHIVGTLSCLSQSEQDRIVGFVINRFRGDIALLQSGLNWLEEKTGKPVLAVLPYLQNFYLDAEDSIHGQQSSTKDNNPFTIVVPVLGRISNHTDFDTLKLNPNIHLIFAAPGQSLPNADLIILPGSKNVRADLKKLKQHGWQHDITRHLRYGGKVFGICGGYQILGNVIHDPQGIEDQPGSEIGLGLLRCETTITENKTLKHVSGEFCNTHFQSTNVRGYEIHAGITHGDDCVHALINIASSEEKTISSAEEKPTEVSYNDGATNREGTVAGTYLHGIFDTEEATTSILTWAGYNKKNTAIDLDAHRETQLNRLADTLDKHVNKEFLANLLA